MILCYNIPMKKKLKNIKIYKKIITVSALSLILTRNEFDVVIDNYVPCFNTGNINLYKDSIKEQINFKIEKDYVPQGMCIINDKIVVSLYNKDYNNNSCLYVIDKNTYKYKKVELDIKAHCGAIAYDNINDNVWISANDGFINCYKLFDILNKSSVENIKSVDCSDHLENHKGNESVSYLTYHKGEMFVGNFNVLSLKTIMKVYEVDSTNLKFKNKIKMPNYIQGISFKDDKMFLSRSYGENNTSQILVYDFKKNDNNYIRNVRKEITCPSLQQQIVFDDDNLFLLYESNSNLYQNEIIKSDDIVVVNYKKLIK